MTFKEDFSNHLKKFNSTPFLFIGSGLSRRYLGLESWGELLEKFSKEINKNFNQYCAKTNSNFPKVATLLAKDYNKNWWTDPKFKEHKNQIQTKKNKGEIEIKTDIELKYEISEYLRNKEPNLNSNSILNKEIEAFKKVTIDGIITTNWDLFLEEIFKFTPFIGQNELLFSDKPQLNIAEIYKIHGCCTKPNSLVLTENDYKNFNDKNPYLAAKLLTIFVEHPIIFLGYSISDENIKNILKSIVSCLDNNKLESLKERLIFVEYKKNSKEKIISQSMNFTQSDFSLPMTKIELDSFLNLYEVLSEKKRTTSVSTLKKIKSQIYELVTTNDPNCKLGVVDIEDITDYKNIEFVCGVGVRAKFGYRGVKIEELFEDIVFNNKDFDSQKIITETIQDLIARNPPIFKYLKNIKFNELDNDLKSKIENYYKENIIKNSINNKINKFISKCDKTFYNKNKDYFTNIKTFTEYFNNNFEKYIPYIHLFGNKVNSDDLDEMMKECFTLLKNDNFKNSHYRKAIRYYDWLKYGQNFKL